MTIRATTATLIAICSSVRANAKFSRGCLSALLFSFATATSASNSSFLNKIASLAVRCHRDNCRFIAPGGAAVDHIREAEVARIRAAAEHTRAAEVVADLKAAQVSSSTGPKLERDGPSRTCIV
jgi:hypothetical protein